MDLRIREISAAEHLAVVGERGSASFLQTPAWGQVKAGWRAQSLGWEDPSGVLLGAGLVLYRSLPRVGRSLAYLPEGPLIDWADPDLGRWLGPLAAHARSEGAFAVRIGPPVEVRRWHTATVKAGLLDPAVHRLADLPPDATSADGLAAGERLRALGWRAPRSGEGFSAGQPRTVFQLPIDGRSDDELLAGFNQLWRRNIKKAAKAGVAVQQGGYDDLAAFHRLYLETARRDGFTARPLSYFQQMWHAMAAEDPDRLRLYLAEREGGLLAATTWVRVGSHVWYSYGASSTEGREHRGSNAVQWQMLRDAREAGAAVYDLRGITDTLDADDPTAGLVQFKLGTGGDVVETLGEWDLPLNRLLHAAFDAYLRRRSGGHG